MARNYEARGLDRFIRGVDRVMADKKSFVMYRSWGAAIEKMSDEQAGKLIKAIYALQENPEASNDDPAIEFVFEIIKEKMIEDTEAYEATCRRRSEAGKKGNETRWSGADTEKNRKCDKGIAKIANAINVSQKSQKVANVADTESDTDMKCNEVPSVPVERGTRKRFSPPAVEEVADYCWERKNNVNPETFVDFYTSKGWKVGKEPMKDWKACVRTWEKRDIRGTPKKKNSFCNFKQNGYDFDELEKLLVANRR